MTHPITVAGIGEILWDVLEDSEQLGGAPINFAYHINALGGRGVPITSIGDDERGRRALLELEQRGVDTRTISTMPGYATGSVQVSVDAAGVASYDFARDTAWDHLLVNPQASKLAPSLQGICFGTLGQRSPMSRTAILGFIDDLPADALRIFDLNLRQDYYSRQIIADSLQRADILKLSDEELLVIAPMFGCSGNDAAALNSLMTRFNLDLAILTRGANGCLLLDRDEFVDMPGIPTTVSDTIGAGDAFTAATALGRLLRKPLPAIADHANRVAAFVCSRKGAMPIIPETLKLLSP